MNCNVPVYREAYKLSQGTRHEIWSPLWLLERHVNAAISQITEFVRQQIRLPNITALGCFTKSLSIFTFISYVGTRRRSCLSA